MNRFVTLTAATLLVSAVSSTAAAQERAADTTITGADTTITEREVQDTTVVERTVEDTIVTEQQVQDTTIVRTDTTVRADTIIRADTAVEADTVTRRGRAEPAEEVDLGVDEEVDLGVQEEVTLETQEGTRPPILGPPSFALMAGGLVANAVSAPEGLDSEAGFMVRFQTTIPTASPFLVGVAGLQWAPNGTENNTDGNAPVFFLGPVLLTPAEWTRGWLLLGLDALWVYSFGGGDRIAEDGEDDVNTKLFGHDLFAEFVVIVPFGSKIAPTAAAPLSGMSFVGLVTQRITNLGEDPDRFSPLLLGYLSIPLAPW